MKPVTITLSANSYKPEGIEHLINDARASGMLDEKHTITITNEKPVSPYALAPVAKGGPYTNISGEGKYVVKVRAIVRDSDESRVYRSIVEKRGVALQTDDVTEAPAFVLNVFKEWDGRGELQYCIFDTDELGNLTAITSSIFPDWHTL